jgi:hypothetical protein
MLKKTFQSNSVLSVVTNLKPKNIEGAVKNLTNTISNGTVQGSNTLSHGDGT